MLPISLARHSSSMPMLSNAFQRLRVGAAVQLRRLSYQCPCFSMHLLFCAALFCAFARPLAANPTQCRATPAMPTPFFAPPSPVDAVLFRCNFSLCRAFPSQSTALPLLSASVPQQIESLPLRRQSVPVLSYARLVFAQRTVQLPSPPCRRASARCTSMQFLCHSRHCYAEAARVVSSPSLCLSNQFHSVACQCCALQNIAAAVVRHSVAYAP